MLPTTTNSKRAQSTPKKFRVAKKRPSLLKIRAQTYLIPFLSSFAWIFYKKSWQHWQFLSLLLASRHRLFRRCNTRKVEAVWNLKITQKSLLTTAVQALKTLKWVNMLYVLFSINDWYIFWVPPFFFFFSRKIAKSSNDSNVTIYLLNPKRGLLKYLLCKKKFYLKIGHWDHNTLKLIFWCV